jgi:Predicted transcriptional regulators
MDLGKKIYELRKVQHITQEQLAKAVGVSTPAVCKWETGAAFPDITLLAPIARKLGTNLDELMSFRETLSSLEIKEIVDKIKELARNSGLIAGMELSQKYLHQYPNVDELKLQLAIFPQMMAHTADEEIWSNEDNYQKLMDETTVLLEELTNSREDTIRMAAIMSVAGRYMQEKRFEEAEAMLLKLPSHNINAGHMLDSLYYMKGDYEKAMETSQSNMLQDSWKLLMDIRGQHKVYLQEKNYEKALKCAHDYLSLVRIAGTPAMCGNELLVITYQAMERTEEAVQYLLDYLDEAKNVKGDYHESFYYSYIADKVAVSAPKTEKDVRISLYLAILHDDRISNLLKTDKVSIKLEELKQSIYPVA